MTAGEETQENTAALSLRVAAEPDPSALGRILAHFHNLNIVPRRVVVESATTGLLHVQVEVFGVSERRLSLIAAKIAQQVPVLHAFWHPL